MYGLKPFQNIRGLPYFNWICCCVSLESSIAFFFLQHLVYAFHVLLICDMFALLWLCFGLFLVDMNCILKILHSLSCHVESCITLLFVCFGSDVFSVILHLLFAFKIISVNCSMWTSVMVCSFCSVVESSFSAYSVFEFDMDCNNSP